MSLPCSSLAPLVRGLLSCAAALTVLTGACRDPEPAQSAPAAQASTKTPAAPAKTPTTPTKTPAAPAKTPAPPAAADDAGAPATSASTPGAGDTGTSAAAAVPGQGRDFIAEARVLYRVVACAGDDPVPAHLDAAVIEAHCKRITANEQHYRDRYATMAKEFIAKLRPEGLPDVVVYPFGGGDLISALVAYPDAREITTMSLEHGGDPRRIREIGAQELEESLAAFRREIGGMLSVSNNTSVNLSSAHTNLLPAQLSSFLVGLAVHDFEPVSVRYFTLTEDGSLHYLNDAEIKEMEDQQAHQLKHDWVEPNFSAAFSNVEIQFRARGAESDAPVRVHRHLAANLANRHLDDDGPVMKHLRSKGRVAAMTKAASYLLWRGDFSRIRDYLLEHMEFMISDSTGIPPAYARRAGMVQTPLGRFSQSFLDASEQHNLDFQELWASKPYRRLPFRFGYVDAERQRHLLITRPGKHARKRRSGG
ncbi:hypothetical protein [Haliangium sp.]|uniref:hypothetical protein n=1 Tax=Haliangium sp. TaxID=2663208 RepID=UPI003D10B889